MDSTRNRKGLCPEAQQLPALWLRSVDIVGCHELGPVGITSASIWESRPADPNHYSAKRCFCKMRSSRRADPLPRLKLMSMLPAEEDSENSSETRVVVPTCNLQMTGILRVQL